MDKSKDKLIAEWRELSAAMDEVEPESEAEMATLNRLGEVEAELGPETVEALIDAA